MHDPRIGRFFAIDPLAPQYPHNSVYAFSENVVIDHVELEGLEKAPVSPSEDQPDGTTSAATDYGIGQSDQRKPAEFYEVCESPLTCDLPDDPIIGPLSRQEMLDKHLLGERIAEIKAEFAFREKLYGDMKVLGVGTSALIMYGMAELVAGEFAGSYAIRGFGALKKWTSANSVGRSMSMQKFVPELASAPSPVVVMSDYQLVSRIATKAENAIGGSGMISGRIKHKYAENLLLRYNRRYNLQMLEPEEWFNNGVGNRGRLDVVNHQTKTIYDYKFGYPKWPRNQFEKYKRNWPGYSIQIILP